MAKKNRSTLKRFFSEGSLPTEDQFGDLIDSSLNTIDEGFDKTSQNGLELSLVGDHDRLISFFRTSAAKDMVWSISYDKEQDRLFIRKPDAESKIPPAMTFTGDGKVGLSKSNPVHTLDVEGVVASHGRLGAYPTEKKTIIADGAWHNITGPLYGCHAFEVMAGVGREGTGKYALMNAIAVNAFNPKGRFFNFLNLKKRIKYNQSYYLARGNRIKLRWLGEGDKYFLQMKTHCDYGGGVQIRYYLTKLWFDEDMSESAAEAEDA